MLERDGTNATISEQAAISDTLNVSAPGGRGGGNSWAVARAAAPAV